MNYIYFTMVLVALTANTKLEPMNSNSDRTHLVEIAIFKGILLNSIKIVQDVIEENKSEKITQKFTERALERLTNIQAIHLDTYNKMTKNPSKFKKELFDHWLFSQDILLLTKRYQETEKISSDSVNKFKELHDRLTLLHKDIFPKITTISAPISPKIWHNQQIIKAAL